MGKNDSLLAIYQEGVPLSDAALHFAPEDLQREYLLACDHDKARGEAAVRARAQELRSGSIDAATRSHIARELEIDLEQLEADSSYMRVLPDDDRLLSTPFRHHVEYESDMRNGLLVSIRAGQFAAIGYEFPRNVKSPLVQIPSNDLQSFSKINLSTSEIACRGLHFVEVRLVASDSLNGDGNTCFRIGAPSKKTECVGAYKEALGSGKITPSDPKKVVTSVIREILNNSVVPKTIWNHVGPIHLRNQQQEESGNK